MDKDSYHKLLLETALTKVTSCISRLKKQLQGYHDELKELRLFKTQLDTGKTFAIGDFSFHRDCQMLSDHYIAMTTLGLVDYFKKEPSSLTGFQFCSDPELRTFGSTPILHLNNKSVDDVYGHSGASFGWVCRQMHGVALGWDAYVQSCIDHKLQKLEDYENHVVVLSTFSC